MYIILAALGFIITAVGFVLMGFDPMPGYAGVVFFSGLILLIVGAIMANRDGRKQKN